MKITLLSIITTAALALALTKYAPTGNTVPRLIHGGAVERVTAYVEGRSNYCDEADLALVPEGLRNAAIDR
jgi:hypothetical protein